MNKLLLTMKKMGSMGRLKEYLYGWFSMEYLMAGYSTLIYLKTSGEEVEVCGITIDPELKDVIWKDKYPIGRVVRFLRNYYRS